MGSEEVTEAPSLLADRVLGGGLENSRNRQLRGHQKVTFAGLPRAGAAAMRYFVSISLLHITVVLVVL